MEDITLVFNWTLVIAISAIPIDPTRKYPEYVIPGLTRNPAPDHQMACFERSLDTGFRRYDVYTVCSPNR
jgi:hypothetical protein